MMFKLRIGLVSYTIVPLFSIPALKGSLHTTSHFNFSTIQNLSPSPPIELKEDASLGRSQAVIWRDVEVGDTTGAGLTLPSLVQYTRPTNKELKTLQHRSTPVHS